jgi:hypothetical protein
MVPPLMDGVIQRPSMADFNGNPFLRHSDNAHRTTGKKKAAH